MLTALFIAPVTGHSGHEQTSSVVKYEVNATNETAVSTWFNPDYTQQFHYQITNNSQIEAELANPESSTTSMNFTIGNLTRIGISDVEVQGNLFLGHYQMPSQFGIIANTSWEAVKQEFNQLDLNDSVFDTSAHYQFGVANFEAVNISFVAGMQHTELVYNLDSGLLYYANLTFGNFHLEFGITGYIPGFNESPSPTESNTAPLGIFMSILALASGVTVDKRRR